MTTPEHLRLKEIKDDVAGWRRWGPYVGERAWATVREDYSPHGDAWGHLSHDLARSKAFRWGEDGIAGFCDRYQLLCLAPAFWNGRDPFLKERLFGLTPHEGNHGEDVKEYYFYEDGTPTHSYMQFLYKYPQGSFPYRQLIEENQKRQGQGLEYELLDTGIFEENRYFDIVIEYAKDTPEDIALRLTAHNRGPEAAPLHLLLQLWFRNTWGWGPTPLPEPEIRPGASGRHFVSLTADDSRTIPPTNLMATYQLGPRTLYGPPGAKLLFTDNETNAARVYGSEHVSRKPHTKDAFHRHIVNGEDSLNRRQVGTKAALHYSFEAVPQGGSVALRLRFSDNNHLNDPIAEVDSIIDLRKEEADAFYGAIHPPRATAEERQIERQALAGLLWTKQNYIFDVETWLNGDNPQWPPPASRKHIRNYHWRHLNSMRVMTVCDKWEYPWFAAWDLAFHCVALAVVDPAFAKDQLWQMLFEQFQHPNGQIPAYEWEFSDLNPPVHAWAVWRVFNREKMTTGHGDRDFLERCFHKLLINFAFWVNKVDSSGNNIFEGGFLGLDNITVVDRSMPLPQGTVLEQSDATGWMGMFCLNLMRIALELARENPVYEGLAIKFFQHYVYVAAAMKHMGGRNYQLWDERDGFFYDVLRFADGRFRKFRLRSLVGLIPLFAVERLEPEWLEPFPRFRASFEWFLRNRRDLARGVVHPRDRDGRTVYALTIVDQDQLERIMERLWDETEFLSAYGIRSLSKFHEQHPFEFEGITVGYEPAESASKLKGGNSNWRGPIWFPTCYLLVESMRKLAQAFGTDFRLTLPASGGQFITFTQMAAATADRLISLFRRDESGRRPIYGGTKKFQEDPFWRDHLLFYEYFHGDNGAGLGGAHTAWTSLVAALIDEWRR